MRALELIGWTIVLVAVVVVTYPIVLVDTLIRWNR